jgi:hypothetical protein
MPSIQEWWKEVWGTVQHSPAILPTHYQILANNSDKEAGETFKGERHYFTVRVNRIFLQYGRDFWTTYAPMALIVAEFKYEGNNTVVPFVVGPSLLEKEKIELPSSFLFENTKVAGILPYKGGGLKLTLILYQVKRSDLSQKLLKLMENVAGVLDFSQTLASYLKIATVLIDVVGDVIGADKDNQPLIGMRKEFDPDDGFVPGYFALIDSRNIKIAQNKLWVRDNNLFFGDSAETSREFRDANYILYRIQQAATRDDAEQISPVYELWQKVKTEAAVTRPDNWDITKALMSSLYQQMVTSPNLTEDHANVLNDVLVGRMVRIHQRALENAQQGRRAEKDDRLDKARNKALDILKL